MIPSGSGLKSDRAAASRASSRSFPASLKISRPLASVTHDSSFNAGSPALLPTNGCSLDQEFWTTFQPYPAEGVVWIRMTPSAFFRSPISYL